MAKRKSISKKTRFEVFKRDAFTCQYCGRRAPDVVLQVDHIHPVSKGGDNDVLNLVTSCDDCNGGKSDRELSDQSALAAQRDQLAELQNRREQLEMMMKWKCSLLDLKEDEVKLAAEFWKQLLEEKYYLNDLGIPELRKLIRRYGANSVTDAMRVAVEKHCNERDDHGRFIAEDVNKAWGYVHRVCAVGRVCERKPHMRDLFYIRGILRNRVHVNDRGNWQSLELLKEAHAAGVDIDALRDTTKNVGSWTEWTNAVRDMIADAEAE